jgi:hypothetical protein
VRVNGYPTPTDVVFEYIFIGLQDSRRTVMPYRRYNCIDSAFQRRPRLHSHSGSRGIAMGFLHLFHDGLISFVSVVTATTAVALVCHYFTCGWPSVLESLFWDFIATLMAWFAFAALPLWHIMGRTLPWSGEPEPVEAYRVLLELSALGSLVGYVIGAMLLPILFKRLGWWH